MKVLNTSLKAAHEDSAQSAQGFLAGHMFWESQLPFLVHCKIIDAICALLESVGGMIY